MLDRPRNLSSEWGRLLVEGLAAAGVRDVVVAPGSRSTPFVLAATSDERLRCVDIVDERSAAFFALGQGRASGRPTLFLCTSGTAGANAYPAVVEASISRVPLLVLTADRPFDRRECGAPQTVDQTRLFGDHVRWFLDLGAPDPEERSLRSLLRRALQAFARTCGEVPGPVHLNAPVRKPLEPPVDAAPSDADAEAEEELERRVSRIAARQPAFERAGTEQPDAALVERLVDVLSDSRRPLVVAGPAPLSRVRRARSVGSSLGALALPLHAEAASQLALPDRAFSGPRPSRLAGFAAVLGSPSCRAALDPDLVLQLGTAPTAGGWELAVERWCGRGDARHVALADGGWPDPVSTVDWMVRGDVAELLAAAAARSEERGVVPARDPSWLERLAEVTAEAQRLARHVAVVGAVEGAAEGSVEGGSRERTLTEPVAVRAVVEALPEGALLALGNSLPIRSVDLYASDLGFDRPVWSQRGANGIDGLVSGAAGTLSAWGGGSGGALGVLLLGDVSLRHDLGGLATLRHLGAPGAEEEQAGLEAAAASGRLVIVVLDNGGGRIFDQLPAHALELGDRWRFWSTPHGVEWSSVAAAFGIEYLEAESPAAARAVLREVLARPSDRQRPSSLIRLRVDPDSARRAIEELRRHLDTWALDTGSPPPQPSREPSDG